MQPLVDALKEAEHYLIKDIEDLENQLLLALKRVDELRMLIKQRKTLLSNSSSVTGSGLGGETGQLYSVQNDYSDTETELDAVIEGNSREEVAAIVASDAVRSKKARTVAMFLLHTATRPLSVREIMDGFRDFRLDLDPRKRRDYDLVRHAIDSCFVSKMDGVRYYWPTGKTLPDGFDLSPT